MNSQTTIIISPRDRFSVLVKCVRNVMHQTTVPVDIILAAGGVPEPIRKRLESEFSGKVKFIFRDEFLNASVLRNIALRETKTETAVCIDSDVFPRPGWLEPLLECYRETGAVLISPVVLDRQNLIHTAGNECYVTEGHGKKYGMAELHYANLPVSQTTNIKRREMDYAEVHCHFVNVEKALNLGIYDEHFREGMDFDSGMTVRKAGEKVILEPRSMVYLHLPEVLKDMVDLEFFIWKWDLNEALRGFEYFEKKWGIDMIGRSGIREYIIMLNHRVGFCTRLWPSAFSMSVDGSYLRAKKTAIQIFESWRGFKNWVVGFHKVA